MSKKFTGCMFIFALMAFLCWSVYSYAAKKTRDFTSSKTDVEIDWEALYPFVNDKTPGYNSNSKENIISMIYSYVKEHCEFYSSERLAGYHNVVEAAKKYEDIVGWNMVSVLDYNAVVKLHDGYLTTYTASTDVTENANSTIELAEFCREKGIEFFYANLPAKICISEDKNISGILDFSNQNADRFLAMLDDAGVRYYDFRKLLHDDGMNHHEAFYVTDHHWKPETGLWAARHVLRILHDDYGYDVNPDVLNPDRFDYVIYPEWFLGSQGKKVTLKRTKPEDFTMIYPKFKTHIHYEIPSAGINTSGDFMITYSMEYVRLKDYYNQNPYAVYNHADQPLINIENLMNNGGKKILIIHESFSNSLIPFAAMDVQYTSAIDMRHFTGSLRSYISKHKPDLLVISYNSGITSSSVNLKTHSSMYDFR